MSDLSRAVRRDKTGLLRAVVTLIRDFMIAQLLGGHSRKDTDALIERANALKAEADSDGDGIPDSVDPTPYGDKNFVQGAAELYTPPATPSLFERMSAINTELAALPESERSDLLAKLYNANQSEPPQ